MASDPALSYAGPESRSLDVTAILYGGGGVVVRGVIGNFETSAGEASAAFADAGPVAWIAFDGDISQIEFVEYVEPGIDTHSCTGASPSASARRQSGIPSSLI